MEDVPKIHPLSRIEFYEETVGHIQELKILLGDEVERELLELAVQALHRARNAAQRQRRNQE